MTIFIAFACLAVVAAALGGAMGGPTASVLRTFEYKGKRYTRGVAPLASVFGDDLEGLVEQGLVWSPEDFGRKPAPPSNPPMTSDAEPSLTGLDLPAADLETLKGAGLVGRVELAAASDEAILALPGIGAGKLATIRAFLDGKAKE